MCVYWVVFREAYSFASPLSGLANSNLSSLFHYGEWQANTLAARTSPLVIRRISTFQK
jgi:hypothetical protein